MFLTVLNVSGPIRMRSDTFGCVRIHSDAFGRFQKIEPLRGEHARPLFFDRAWWGNLLGRFFIDTICVQRMAYSPREIVFGTICPGDCFWNDLSQKSFFISKWFPKFTQNNSKSIQNMVWTPKIMPKSDEKSYQNQCLEMKNRPKIDDWSLNASNKPPKRVLDQFFCIFFNFWRLRGLPK